MVLAVTIYGDEPNDTGTSGGIPTSEQTTDTTSTVNETPVTTTTENATIINSDNFDNGPIITPLVDDNGGLNSFSVTGAGGADTSADNNPTTSTTSGGSSLSRSIFKLFDTLGTIKKPATNEIVPNPMHKFASWTYSWSLWWLSSQDYNAMQSGNDVGTALSFPLSGGSYVVAEDSGLYPNRRLPTQLGLNYNIQDVEFETVVGLNSTSKSSNMISGKLTIIEPYGVTFVDSLIQAGFTGQQYLNYTDQPYMLQLDFTGYDDSGKPVPQSETAVYRKRFPIKFLGVKIEVSGKGAKYDIQFYPVGHSAQSPENCTTLKDITVTASTVKDFFDPSLSTSFTSQLNAHYRSEVGGRVQYADSYSFEFDSTIANSNIVYPEQSSLTQANPNDKKGISLTASSFSIPAGTNITQVIQKVLVQSSYLQEQLGVSVAGAIKSEVEKKQTQILNTFKTTTQVFYSGVNSAGVATNGVFDNIRNKYPSKFIYKVHQYPVYDPVHPTAPLLADSRPYVVKDYRYLYTGKNTDVLDFKINFDTTWYTAVMSYTDQYSSQQATPSTAIESLLSASQTILLSPQFLAYSGLAGNSSLGILGKIPVVAPVRYKPIVNDQRDTVGFGAASMEPGAQKTANVMKTLYNRPSGDMLSLTMDIVGDPTLIKQDDWLYNPSPNASGTYGSWMSMGQHIFAQQHGHIRMDTGALVVLVTINSPMDIDSDWTNQGLAFPQPNTYKSLFSGLYKVLTIKNTFSGGVFKQQLQLVRLMNSDYVTNSAPETAAGGRDASTTAQNNLNSTNDTVTTTATSDVSGASSTTGTTETTTGASTVTEPTSPVASTYDSERTSQ